MRQIRKSTWLQTLEKINSFNTRFHREFAPNIRNARFIPKDQLRRLVTGLRTRTTEICHTFQFVPDRLKGKAAKEKYAIRQEILWQIRVLERVERIAGLRGIKLPRWRNRRLVERVFTRKLTQRQLEKKFQR